MSEDKYLKIHVFSRQVEAVMFIELQSRQKCSFRSAQHPPPGFREQRNNSHAVCSTLIGCTLMNQSISVK